MRQCHEGEAELPEDFDVEVMDVAERFPVPFICVHCAAPIAIAPGHYQSLDGILERAPKGEGTSVADE